jgi:hypothetical protein
VTNLLELRRRTRPDPAPPAAARLLGPGVRAIVVAASRDPNAKITTLVVPPGADGPTLAVKTPTSDRAALGVGAEAAILRALPTVLPPDLLRTVPRLVGPVDPVTSTMVTTTVHGTPMQVSYHRWRHVSRAASVARDFGSVQTWLTRLHDATAADPAPVTLAARLLPGFRARFATDPSIGVATAALLVADRRLAERRSVRTVVHGDFWHGNVLTARGSVVGVVDWEAGVLKGEPIRDVARFALAYALYLDRHTRSGKAVRHHPWVRAGEWGAGVRSVFAADGWFAGLVQDFVAGQLERLGIGGDLWREALVVGLAEAAVAADDPEFAARHVALLAACAPWVTGVPLAGEEPRA